MEFLNELNLEDDVKKVLSEKLQSEFQSKLESETSGLKSKVDELLAEKKKVQQEREEARRLAKEEAEAKAKADNDYKQLFESQKQESDSLKSKLEELSTNIKRQKIGTEAAKLAARLTKDAQKAQLLQQQISQRLTLVDDEIRVADESGQLTVSTLDDLATSIKTAYPFLVDGSQAQGGGAARGQGGAGGQQKQISRADFDAMNHGKRAEFIKSGGKIFDE